MKVKDIMTKEVFTLRTDHKLDLAQDIMQWQRIRHIPVVDQSESLVGMVTHRDLLRAAVSSLAGLPTGEQREIYSYIPVAQIMSTNPLTTSPDTDLRVAATMMLEKKIGALPVLEGRRLVGIVTESDFLSLAWGGGAARRPTATTSRRGSKSPSTRQRPAGRKRPRGEVRT